MAVCKRVLQLVANSAICLSKSPKPAPARFYGTSSINRFDYRGISQLVKSNGSHAFLVDTLAFVRRLEAQGIPSKQAESITAAITEVLNDSIDNVAHAFVSKSESQKIEMVQESNHSTFTVEIQSSQVLTSSSFLLI